MAANDYYNGFSGGSSSNNNAHSGFSNPYSGRDDTAHPRPIHSDSPAPSYATLAPAPPPKDGQLPRPSPFETPFDDHVYPLDGRQQHSNMNDFTSQDTAYGHQRPNDIPLQTRPPKDIEMANDHVYDAPESGRPTPVQQKKKKRGNIQIGQLGMFGSDNTKRIPWVVYLFTLIQVGVFIGEFVRNATLTGSPIATKPFNPMIGPSQWVLINMGARYVPCMHNVPEVQGFDGNIHFPCPSEKNNPPTTTCTLSDLCGFGGVPNPEGSNPDQKPEPNQSFRFITPIFMHAGLIHLGFNMLLQLTIGKELERAIGPVRFFLVYMSAGIFGNVMGANYAGDGLPSVGASGALFGIIALILLDLLYSWQERRNPVKDLLFILLDMVISFVLGLLPGLDNFAHIGGFIMGLALGICVLHSPNALRRRLGHASSYSAVSEGEVQASFLKNPLGFFKGRKPLWWAWWMVRAGALLAVAIGFIVLLQNFYVVHKKCSWCKYLSCVPISNWCDFGNLQFFNENGTTPDSNSRIKRDMATFLATAVL